MTLSATPLEHRPVPLLAARSGRRFWSAFDDVLASGRVQPLQRPPRGPNLNASAKSRVRSVRPSRLPRYYCRRSTDQPQLPRVRHHYYRRQLRHQPAHILLTTLDALFDE
jgi:hypothetical protein